MTLIERPTPTTILKEEHENNLSKEIHDYLRNGDKIILKRILLKLFANQPINDELKPCKANALILMMLQDSEISYHVNLRQ